MKSRTGLIASFLLLFFLLVSGASNSKISHATQQIIEDFLQQPHEEVRGETHTGTLVTRVVDGDTIEVLIGEDKAKIRLIGINSPESVDPRREVECFGKEAKIYLDVLVLHKSVRLVRDETQLDRDRYGRLLRYVFLEDGTHINERMITEGFAYEYTYESPYKYQALFNAAEDEASQNKRGLWSPETCAGSK